MDNDVSIIGTSYLKNGAVIEPEEVDEVGHIHW